MTLPVPTVLPVWATTDQVDQVSQQNNVLTPPPEMQTFGWTRGEFPPRQWFNWLGRYTYQWLAYLAQQQALNVVTNGTNSPVVPVLDPTKGGMVRIQAVDSSGSNPTYYVSGICYFPPNSASPVPVNIINYTTLTLSSISTAGIVTVGSGSGTYILSAQVTP